MACILFVTFISGSFISGLDIKYDVSCTGKESNYSPSASTTLYLTYST